MSTVAVPPRSATPAAANELRGWLKARREDSKAEYLKRPDPARLLAETAAHVDDALTRLWMKAMEGQRAALVAVGGYGRGALFPHSDVDILVLLPDGEKPGAPVERFIHSLWDLGLEPGHSVRTVSQCIEESEKDVTVDTSLLEARLVAGDPALMLELDARLRARRDVRAFFDAKFREQKRRHERY